MAMALTGLKSGMGPNKMRPAAANAANTSVGIIWRRPGREARNPQRTAQSTSATTTSMANAACSTPASNAAAITAGTASSSGISICCKTRDNGSPHQTNVRLW